MQQTPEKVAESSDESSDNSGTPIFGLGSATMTTMYL